MKFLKGDLNMELSTLRVPLAEFLGTALFVFMGVATAVTTEDMIAGESAVVRLVAVAFAFGLAIALVVAALGRFSGAHVNPAVTLAALATGKIEVRQAPLYVVSQLSGAIAGSALVLLVTPGDAGPLGATTPGSGVNIGMGLVTEGILTFFLMFVIFASAIDPKGPAPMAPMLIGLAVAVGILAGGGLTGGSMNPARSFGPAVIGGEWQDHWVYWVGPITGAIVAAVVYTQVFLKGDPATD